MRKYIFKHKLWLFFAVLFRCIGAFMQVFIAILVQRIIDSAMDKNMSLFIKMIVIAGIYFVIMALNDYLNKTTQYTYMKKTLTDFKEDVFCGILKKDYKSFNENNTAQYISNLTNDINMVETKYIVPSLEMIGDVIIFVTTLILLLIINPYITLGMCLTTSMIFIIPTVFGKVIAKKQTKVSSGLSSFTIKIKDIFSGYEVIKSYNADKIMANEFSTENNKIENLKFKANHIQGISDSVSLLLAILTQVSATAIGGYFLIKGSLSVGGLFAVLQLGNGLFNPVMWIMNKVTMLKGMKEVNKKLIDIIKENEKVDTGKVLNSFEEKIEIKDISFSYNEKDIILDEVSVSFDKGKKYAIVGKSGSGKSTLLRLMMGYYSNYTGDISIDDKNYEDLNKSSIFNNIAIIHQDVYMFSKTLEENIKLGKDFTDKELQEAMFKSGVSEFINKLPNGINSEVGENGKSVSGGQRQRIAIARALLQNTSILLLDEGTSSLDAKTSFEIEDTILSIEGLTVIAITHKLNEEILKRYDEIIVMENGKIVEKGHFDSLVALDRKFSDMYNLVENLD